MLSKALKRVLKSQERNLLAAIVLLPLVVLALPLLFSGFRATSSEKDPGLDLALLVEPNVRASESCRTPARTNDDAENLVNWQYTPKCTGS